MKKLLIILGLFSALLLCLCTYACKNNNNHSQYSINFIVEDETYSTQYANFGETITEPESPLKDGKIFKGWYKAADYVEKWNFKSDVIKDNLTLYGYFTDNETFNVLYYDNGYLINHESLLKNTCPSYYEPASKEGYAFKGWLNGNNIFSFSTKINNDIVLTAKWDIVDYHIKFIADNELVGECTYNIENRKITAPLVPQKLHYDGEWQKFNLDLKDTEVNAVYTPIIYSAIFIADGKEISKISYTVEDDIQIPDVPEKIGYNGVWTEFSLDGDVTVTAIYTPIVYTATYICENNIIDVLNFTIEDKNITPPAVPQKQGYSGEWEETELSANNVTINAIYEPIKYNVTFVINNQVFAVLQFDILHRTIQEPTLIEKIGYSAQWEPYELILDDIVVKAMYTPIVYKADFIIDGIKIGTTEFTIEDTRISFPNIENRQGYSFRWEDYEIRAENIEIVGHFSPITYSITFIADDVVVEKIEYTVENKDIIEPTPPAKDGYDVTWEPYEITFGDIIVKAVYTPIAFDNAETDDFIFALKEDDTYCITGYTGKEVNLTFPSSFNGKMVSSIGVLDFKNSKVSADKIEIVKINEGIKIIEDKAFYCFSSLIEVVLPNSLLSIGDMAFAYCPFTSIFLPENLTFIGKKAFVCTQLRNITLPDKLKEIDDIFFNCKALKNVVLGKQIEKINSEAFYGCSSLSEVHLNENLKTISTHSFSGCESLENIVIPRSVIFIECEAFYETALTNVIFEKVDNWFYCNEENVAIGELAPEKLSDHATAAYWLTTVYKTRNLINK